MFVKGGGFMSSVSKTFMQIYGGHKDLSRRNTPSGHFTLYKRDEVVGHVLAGSIQDACRYFLPTYSLRCINKLMLSSTIISFKGYDGLTQDIFSIRRTRWRESYNTPLINGYGHEYMNRTLINNGHFKINPIREGY